jgi:hypothetical protein
MTGTKPNRSTRPANSGLPSRRHMAGSACLAVMAGLALLGSIMWAATVDEVKPADKKVAEKLGVSVEQVKRLLALL